MEGANRRLVLLEREDFATRARAGLAVGPGVQLQEMPWHHVQEALRQMQLRQTHVLGLADDMNPVGLIHPLLRAGQRSSSA
jgi:hypothetical protein